MGREVTELSEAGRHGEKGRAESRFRGETVNFRGSQGKREITRKEPVWRVEGEGGGKDPWGIWCRAVGCVLVGKGFKAAWFLGRHC